MPSGHTAGYWLSMADTKMTCAARILIFRNFQC